MDKPELRFCGDEPLEFRAATGSDTGIGTFSGYAIRYDKPSLPLPFIETFKPGAFTRSLKSKNDVRLYVNHDDRMVLASRRAKTLRIEDRSDGLWIEADLPDTSYANDLRVLMERGDVHTQSIGFAAVRDAWSPDYAQRTVTEAKLFDSSVVTGIAAYQQSTASVRNMIQIARRTETDADALADAMSALESGDVLTDEQASLLRVVVDRAAGVIEEAPADPIGIPLSVLQKQLELAAKA